MDTLIKALAAELGRSETHVKNVIDLIDEGATIPFIARYRKELHGSMDDQLLRTLADRLQYLRNLAQRRQEVKTSIENQGKLTDELAAAIDAAATLAEVEDLYRPYKQKRRTRATVAREKGLEPLALLFFAKGAPCPDPEAAARDYIDPEKGVESVEDALQGANDIIAELISGKLDGAYIEWDVAESYQKNYPELKILCEVPYEAEGNVIGVAKNNADLLKYVNEALNKCVADGDFAQFVATALEQAAGDNYQGLLDEEGNIPDAE
jgi:transcriptional accessory protein Tex/SPT6